MVVWIVTVPSLALPLATGSDGQDKGDAKEFMKFVHVPKGTFWMSANKKNAQTQVTIDKDFELGAYTVTQEEWQAVMGSNPSVFSKTGLGKDRLKDIPDADVKRFPVEMVSWDDAQVFMKKLNAREMGKGWVYRLPTEAEWEFACRAGATTKEECSFDFYLEKPTNTLPPTRANIGGNGPGGQGAAGSKLARTTKVGSYAPNKLGFYDMHGNVSQWCQDYFGKGADRVTRGGSWRDAAEDCRAASRAASDPSDQTYEVGFRVCRVASPAK